MPRIAVFGIVLWHERSFTMPGCQQTPRHFRAVPLEAIDRDMSAAIYQLICGSNHYHRMLSTALESLRGVQESERLMVAIRTERDAAITAKTEMEGQLKAADEKLIDAEERFLKAEELAHEVELKRQGRPRVSPLRKTAPVPSSDIRFFQEPLWFSELGDVIPAVTMPHSMTGYEKVGSDGFLAV
ncbi:hypothetical protein NE237_012637 [Protea cynaroides]|uniref:Uncharacterized protein n=1 Tax=Protea cynaroides TaxID=273540 RepID=A0A9Q0H2A6_9MAGN|nr:hypothetical protein NE237_012637 [Protea cynaroides]